MISDYVIYSAYSAIFIERELLNTSFITSQVWRLPAVLLTIVVCIKQTRFGRDSLKRLSLLILLSATIAANGCASKQVHEQQAKAQAIDNTSNSQSLDNESLVDEADTASDPDPFESVNRIVWDFNYDVLDRFLVKPLTQGYIAITPSPVRVGLQNAADNIEEPANVVNNLLQGKVNGSMTSVARFAVNSTIGILGIFDVASSMGLEREREDFGQVLGVWGVGTGPYLMLPALGPSDLRSLTGRVADNFYWPSTVLEDPYVIGAALVSLLEARASLLQQEELLNRATDPYLFVRDAYFQNLAFEVSDGQIEQKSEEELEQETEDFSDFEDLLDGI